MERTQNKQIGYSSVEYKSDTYEGQYLDTKVIINDQLLCVIAGNTINEFHEELKTLIDKYRI
jgi:hypothetical protein